MDAYENDEDLVELAKFLKIKKSTAYSIAKRGRATNLPIVRSGLNRNVDDECVDNLSQENALVRIKELNVMVHQLFDKPSFSNQPLPLQQFRFDTINDIIFPTAGEVTQNANPGITTQQPTFQLVLAETKLTDKLLD